MSLSGEVFGTRRGSFDPPHLGHLLLATCALWRCEPGELWLVPVYRHPLGKVLLPFEQRVAMLREAVAPLGSTLSISEVEAELAQAGGSGTTLELLEEFRRRYPKRPLLWVMGADLWQERHLWKSFDRVGQLAELVILNRQGFPALPEGGPFLPQISSADIRQQLKRGETVSNLLPAAVERYIRDHGLYRS